MTTTIPGHYADEPVAYEPDHNHGCGHCDVRGVTLTDCEACGEFVCASCRERLCEQPVMCQCGELRVGREITWTDCEPTCAGCRKKCERCGEMSTSVREYSVGRYPFADYMGDWCSECRGERAA